MVWQRGDRFAYENFLEKHKTIVALTILLFSLLSMRLFYLQIVKGDRWEAIAEQQKLHNTIERAPRGIIYSCNNEVLVDNEFVYVALCYTLDGCQKISEETLESLSRILGREIKPKVDNGSKFGRVLRLAENLTIEEMFKIQEQNMNLPGVFVAREPRRVYLLGEASSHVVGYTSEIMPEELEELSEEQGYKYKHGDIVGRGGIEQVYDSRLQGTAGGWEVEVNAKGHKVKPSKYAPPVIGSSLYSTIDSKIQKASYDALKNSVTGKGSVVVLNVKTGAVLALVSCPGFDSNKIRYKEFSRYLDDKNLPFFNRALQALYPPGSIFKVVTFAAAVELLDINPSEKVLCTGKFELGNRHYACWYKSGHGSLNLIQAMSHSCNVYFYQLALKVGIKNLEEFSKKFFLGRKTGVDLPNEKSGLVPSPKWKKAKLKKKWLDGDTVTLGIGQSALCVTPIQMAYLMSIVANKGQSYKPYVVDKIVDASGETSYKHEPEKEEEVELSKHTWDLLHMALLETVESGGAKKCKFKDIKIAGKTGTAQNPQGQDHAWFISYAPADDPEIALAVIVEHGGWGAANAVPIGRKIYETYFNISPETQSSKTQG